MAVQRPPCSSPRSARSKCGGDRHKTLAGDDNLVEKKHLQRWGQGVLKGRGWGRNRRRSIVTAAAVAIVGLLVDVGFPTGAMAMTTGSTHSCIVTDTGEVKVSRRFP